MSPEAWVQRSLQEAVRQNLDFWEDDLTPQIALTEAGNLHAAILYGQRYPRTRPLAARLLVRSFPAAQLRSRDWLPLYQAALSHKQPPDVHAQLLLQQAVLLWQSGDLAGAAAAFRRGARRAAQLGQPSLQAGNLAGLCLSLHGQPAQRRRAASQLRALLHALEAQHPVRAQALAALGSHAFTEKDYAGAHAHFEQALQARPTHGLVRAQLHIACGLCSQAQAQPHAALKHYNAAGAALQQAAAGPAHWAQLELLRASAHYQKRNAGQHVRLQPAIAALQRAAEFLNQSETGEESRALLESFMGRTYTRAGDVERGLQYLTSALELSAGNTDQRMTDDLFEALQHLANKNPA